MADKINLDHSSITVVNDILTCSYNIFNDVRDPNLHPRINKELSLTGGTIDISSLCQIPYSDTSGSPSASGIYYMGSLSKGGVNTSESKFTFFGPLYNGSTSNCGLGLEEFHTHTVTTPTNTIDSKFCYVEGNFTDASRKSRLMGLVKADTGNKVIITEAAITPRHSSIPAFVDDQSLPTIFNSISAKPLNITAISNDILLLLETDSSFYFMNYDDMWSVSFDNDCSTDASVVAPKWNKPIIPDLGILGGRLSKLTGETYITTLKAMVDSNVGSTDDYDYICHVTNKRLLFAKRTGTSVRFFGLMNSIGGQSLNIGLNDVTLTFDSIGRFNQNPKVLPYLLIRNNNLISIFCPSARDLYDGFNSDFQTGRLNKFNIMYPEEGGYDIVYNPFLNYPYPNNISTSLAHWYLPFYELSNIFVVGKNSGSIYKFYSQYSAEHPHTFILVYAMGNKIDPVNKIPSNNNPRQSVSAPILIPFSSRGNYYDTNIGYKYEVIGFLDGSVRNKLLMVEPDATVLYKLSEHPNPIILDYDISVISVGMDPNINGNYRTKFNISGAPDFDPYATPFGISNQISISNVSTMVYPAVAPTLNYVNISLDGLTLTMNIDHLYGRPSNAKTLSNIEVNYKVGLSTNNILTLSPSNYILTDNGSDNYTLAVTLSNYPTQAFSIQIRNLDGYSNTINKTYDQVNTITDYVFHLNCTGINSTYDSITNENITGTTGGIVHPLAPVGMHSYPNRTVNYDSQSLIPLDPDPAALPKFSGSFEFVPSALPSTYGKELIYPGDTDYLIDINREFEIILSFFGSAGTPATETPLIQYGDPSNKDRFAWRFFIDYISGNTCPPAVFQVSTAIAGEFVEYVEKDPYINKPNQRTFWYSSGWNYFKIKYTPTDKKVRMYFDGSNTKETGTYFTAGTTQANWIDVTPTSAPTIESLNMNDTNFKLMVGSGYCYSSSDSGAQSIKYSNASLGQCIIKKGINSQGSNIIYRPPTITNVTTSNSTMTIDGSNLLSEDGSTFSMKLNNNNIPNQYYTYTITSKTQTQVVLSFTLKDDIVWNSSFSISVVNSSGEDSYYILRSNALPQINSIYKQVVNSSITDFVIEGSNFLNKLIMPNTINSSNFMGIYTFNSNTSLNRFYNYTGSYIVGNDITSTNGNNLDKEDFSLFSTEWNSTQVNKVTYLDGTVGWKNNNINFGLSNIPEFSISLWVKPIDNSSYTLLNKSLWYDTLSTFKVSYDNTTTTLTVKLCDNHGTGIDNNNQYPTWNFSNVTLSSTSWNHITITFADSSNRSIGDVVNCFINGIKKSSTVTNNNFVSSTFTITENANSFSIGYDSTTNSDYFRGYIDSVTFFNKELDQSEITTLAYGGLIKLYNTTTGQPIDISNYIFSTDYNVSVTNSRITINNKSNTLDLLSAYGKYEIQNSAGYSNEGIYTPPIDNVPFLEYEREITYTICSNRDSKNTKSYTRKKLIEVVIDGNGQNINTTNGNVTLLSPVGGFTILEILPLPNHRYKILVEYYKSTRGIYVENFSIRVTNDNNKTYTFISKDYVLNTFVSTSEIMIEHDGDYNSSNNYYLNSVDKEVLTFNITIKQPKELILPSDLELEHGYSTIYADNNSLFNVDNNITITDGPIDMLTKSVTSQTLDNQKYFNGTTDVDSTTQTQYIIKYEVVVSKSGTFKVSRLFYSDVLDLNNQNEILETISKLTTTFNCLITKANVLSLAEPDKPTFKINDSESVLPKYLTDKPFNNLFTSMSNKLLNGFYKKG